MNLFSTVLKNLLFLLLITCMLCQKTAAQFSYETLVVQYDSAWTFKNLQLVPIRFKSQGPAMPNLITLSSALAQKKAILKELPQIPGADVHVVSITNTGKKAIFVQSGELITGGKQDRIIAETTIIPPGGKKDYLTTFCIEKGRWDDKPRPFGYAGSGDASLRRTIDTKRTQPEVWKEIERQFNYDNQRSKTWPYLQLYKDSARRNLEYLNYFKEKLATTDSSYAGFIFISGDEIISCELFSNQDFTLITYPAMLATYANTISREVDPPTVSKKRQQVFMDKLLSSPQSQQKMITEQGRAYKYEGQTIHLIVYEQ
jgi:hypothetical protein